MVVTTWAGTKAEWELLKEAISRDCEECAELQGPLCHVHLEMLFSDQRLLDGMVFGRHERERLLAEEGR